MIPVFERAKSVHALDRAATVIGCYAAVVVNLWAPRERIPLTLQLLLRENFS
jgi:hypothetical protein